jgi:hypothetical protein
MKFHAMNVESETEDVSQLLKVVPAEGLAKGF